MSRQRTLGTTSPPPPLLKERGDKRQINFSLRPSQKDSLSSLSILPRKKGAVPSPALFYFSNQGRGGEKAILHLPIPPITFIIYIPHKSVIFFFLKKKGLFLFIIKYHKVRRGKITNEQKNRIEYN